jgi:hypothetical protein
MKRIKWFEILLVAVVLGVHLYAALSEAHNFPNKWFTRDDAFYYFKVAQNITEGHGITFDGINPTNGYHPLWLLVCIPIFALARFDLILPLRILVMVMAGLSAATGVLLYRLGRRTLSEFAGILIASFWTFNLYIHNTITQLGLESGITIFAMVLFLYLLQSFERRWRTEPVSPKQITNLALAGIFLLFSRLDTVFLVTLIGFWIVFRGSPIRYYLMLDLLIIPSSIIISFFLRLGMPMYFGYNDAMLAMIVLALVLRIPLFYFSGLYQPPQALTLQTILIRTLLAVSASTLVIGGLMLAISPFLYGLPRSALLLDWGLCLTLVIASRVAADVLKIGATPQATSEPLAYFKSNWKRWFSIGLPYFGIMGGALGAYMLFNRIVIGAAMPVSGSIKRWWGSLPDRAYGGPANSLSDIFGIAPRGTNQSWQLLTNLANKLSALIASKQSDQIYNQCYFGILAAITLFTLTVFLLNRRRTFRAFYEMGLLPLAIGSEIHVLSYNAMGYAASKEWYWISEMLLIVVVGGLVLDIFRNRLHHWMPSDLPAKIMVGVLAMYMIFGYSQAIIHRMPYHSDNPNQPYMEVATFLEKNTEPGAIIGMTGGGNVGYFIKGRTIVNMDGLINSPEYFDALKSKRGGFYLQAIGMDYIFSNPDILFQSEPYWHQFDGTQYQVINLYGRKALMYILPSQ